VSDSDFILASRHSVNAYAHYDLPTPDSFGKASATLSYYYRSKFYTTVDINTAHCTVPGNPNPAAIYTNCYNHPGKLPGYGLFNLRVDIAKLFGSTIDVAMFINNLTNKYYFPASNNGLGPLGAMSVYVGEPRMFGFEVTVPFGRRAK